MDGPEDAAGASELFRIQYERYSRPEPLPTLGGWCTVEVQNPPQKAASGVRPGIWLPTRDARYAATGVLA